MIYLLDYTADTIAWLKEINPHLKLHPVTVEITEVAGRAGIPHSPVSSPR
jgi:hypothetical protein